MCDKQKLINALKDEDLSLNTKKAYNYIMNKFNNKYTYYDKKEIKLNFKSAHEVVFYKYNSYLKFLSNKERNRVLDVVNQYNTLFPLDKIRFITMDYIKYIPVYKDRLLNELKKEGIYVYEEGSNAYLITCSYSLNLRRNNYERR